MRDTGRIKEVLDARARAIVFGTDANVAIKEELPHLLQVDRAHVVMLVECGIVQQEVAAPLLSELAELERLRFEPLCGKQCPRGLFLMYEQYLIEKLGPQTGGILQTARSRNDLNATLLKLRLRRPITFLQLETVRLVRELTRHARRHSEAVMCLYTHYQPAVPGTYGHYLSGVASALTRDLDGLASASADIDRSPLGAGAVGGTTFPINTARTARLLGFTGGAVNHSLDAVASRDSVLRLLAAGAILGTTLARLASDFLLWSTEEYGYLRFPDHLVGSSSLMPQKRNPFLLEHVKGLSAAPLGAFVASATTIHGSPFTNSVAVGTEAVRDVWETVRRLTHAVFLMRLMVSGASPQPDAMRKRTACSHVTATELANRLVQATDMDFRTAHHMIGELTLVADANGESLTETAIRQLPASLGTLANDLDPAAIARASEYGGGPGQESLQRACDEVDTAVERTRQLIRARISSWRVAHRELAAAVSRILSSNPRT